MENRMKPGRLWSRPQTNLQKYCSTKPEGSPCDLQYFCILLLSFRPSTAVLSHQSSNKLILLRPFCVLLSLHFSFLNQMVEIFLLRSLRNYIWGDNFSFQRRIMLGYFALLHFCTINHVITTSCVVIACHNTTLLNKPITQVFRLRICPHNRQKCVVLRYYIVL